MKNPLLCGAFSWSLLQVLAAAPALAVDYESEIRPILEQHCIKCHGPEKQKAQLRLDRRGSLLRGGDGGLPSLVPGNTEKSHLLERLRSADSSERMPPKGEPLSEVKIATIEKWIAEGAEWPGQMEESEEETTDHWSFQKVVRPRVPGGAIHPVDAFLDAELKDAGLQANGPADARSLIRRAAILLTGLPPLPGRVDRFEAEFRKDADGAYRHLVDELLASPHFGERWAQHWLDVIRWAESNGSEANLYRKNAWFYRDYVVRAFNEDVPYDQFVREQIAGDTLGTGEATGFLVAGPHVPAATVGREPAAIRQARADRMDEVMQTVGASIMGITIGCARCHNHKFDPISLTDYYAMTAVFQDVEFGSRLPEFSPDHPRRRRGDELRAGIAQQRNVLRQSGGWEENWGAYREIHFKPVATRAVRIRFKTANVSMDELQVFGPEDRAVNLAHKQWGTVVSGFPRDGNDGRNPIERVNDGEFGTMAWRARTGKDAQEKPWLRLDFEKPVQIDRLRLSNNREYFFDTDYLTQKPYLPRYEFDLDVQQEDGSWKPWVGTWYVNKKLNQQHPGRKAALGEIQALIEKLAEEGPRPSFVGRLVPPAVTRVLHRGSPESPRDEVTPDAPAIFGKKLNLAGGTPGAKRRAEFAKWLSERDHPLTARVMVNRIWHHLFGSGIVPTPSDFGSAGAPPSHPELLEWLAAEFVEPSGTEGTMKKAWSMKGMIRFLVLSDAFRRASHPSEAGMDVDASCRLLWRFPPRRVSAEVLRDGILQASGKLDTRIGGRSYRIHNVKKTYAQWEVVDNHGPGTWRRMLYQERMRRVDDQIFTAFDFPDCGQVRARRPVSTTPLQALNLMNSPFVTEQGEFLAARAAREAGADEEAQIRRVFALVLSRDPDARELAACRGVDLRLICRSLINSNEFAFLP